METTLHQGKHRQHLLLVLLLLLLMLLGKYQYDLLSIEQEHCSKGLYMQGYALFEAFVHSQCCHGCTLLELLLPLLPPPFAPSSTKLIRPNSKPEPEGQHWGTGRTRNACHGTCPASWQSMQRSVALVKGPGFQSSGCRNLLSALFVSHDTR